MWERGRRGTENLREITAFKWLLSYIGTGCKQTQLFWCNSLLDPFFTNKMKMSKEMLKMPQFVI